MGSLTRFNLRHIIEHAGVDTLVETGTGRGNSLAWAVQAGFKSLHSVEQVAELYALCKERFANAPQVRLAQGESLDFLKDYVDAALKAKQSPKTAYFLDAHFAGGADFGLTTYAESAAREDSYPLLEELKVLLKLDLAGSVIIVDDARMYFDGPYERGECPEWARRWHEREALIELLKALDDTHSVHLLREDEGYLVVFPKATPFAKGRCLMVRPSDSSGPVNFLPNVPGATCISIQRRLADSRFATRYFRGAGLDIGGGQDSLAAYRELFPLVQNVFVYDRPYGDAEVLDNVSDNSFDFVYSSHCLEHMRDPKAALANWVRVTKPGGHLVISVPDEDLYEQGVWPSRFNHDHKHTFTIAKATSWSPVSINLLDFLGAFRDQVEIFGISRIDHGYRYASLPRTVDQTRTPLAESAIEFILQKRAPAA